MPEATRTTEILRRRTLEKVNEYSVRVRNPLDLASEQVAQLEDLADAPVDVLSAEHFVQEGKRCLIDRKGGQPHTMIYLPLRGAIEWRSGDRSWTVRPGQAVIVGDRQPQYADSLEEIFEVISIHLHIRLAAALPDQPLFKQMVQAVPYSKFWHQKLDAAVTLHLRRPRNRTLNDCVRHLLMDLVLFGAEPCGCCSSRTYRSRKSPPHSATRTSSISIKISRKILSWRPACLSSVSTAA